MISFVQNWEKGSYGAKEVTQSLILIILFFIIGNLPATLVFAHLGVSGLHEASLKLGFHALFMLQMVPFLTVLVAFYLAVNFVHKVTNLDWITERPRPSLKKIAFAFAIWSSFLILTVLLQWLLSPKSLTWNFEPLAFFSTLFLLLFFLPLQVLAEELLFRAYALQGLTARLKKPWLAALLSGIMFGLMHLGNPEIKVYGYSFIILYCVLGVFLSVITALDGGIELAFGFHVANNLFSGILVTSKDQALQLPALFSTETGSFDALSLGLLIIGLAAFFILASRRFLWNFGSLIQNIP